LKQGLFSNVFVDFARSGHHKGLQVILNKGLARPEPRK
jgi:hypothetical protein